MSKISETFFTTVGCMDGRVQEAVTRYGKLKFGAVYPDTITEAGLVGKLSKESTEENLIGSIKNKLDISLEKHHSKGIIVHGHQECAGNPVEDEKHKDHVRKSVEEIKLLINFLVPVVGVFVKRSTANPNIWEVEEISPKLLA